MPTGLPRLPDPDERESVVERRCAGCGLWNHAAEARCQRCGRRLESSLGADGRRELEETESLPGPSLAAAVFPKPSVEPSWKDELSKRLAGYRERQAAYEETAEIAKPASERPSLPSRNRSARPNLAPPGGSEFSPLPPPRGHAAPPQRAPEPPRRLAEPPIVDRLLSPLPNQPNLPVRQRPRVEDLLAPIRYRFMAGLFDIGIVGAALGFFLGVMHLTNPAILTGPNRLAVVGGAFVALQVLYWVAYLRLMGSTAGMRWTGLRVLNLDSQPPDLQQRWTRVFGTVLSASALGVGFLWSLFDEQRFTWHDRVSKTYVALDD